MPPHNSVPGEVKRASLVHQLAVLDFQLAPMHVIKEHLKISPSLIRSYRVLKEYREALEEVKQSWTEQMLQTPSSAVLKKEINWGMSMAVKAVLGILSNPKTPNRDLIGAARLVALLDGRFLKTGTESGSESVDNETVATELVEAINRVRGTVQ